MIRKLIRVVELYLLLSYGDLLHDEETAFDDYTFYSGVYPFA